jgi:hypothetical protein
MSAEQLQALLTELYPRFSAKITAVSVEPIPPPKNKQSSAIEMYKQAFGKNESAHHSSLKWFGLHWCMGGSLEFQKFRYEVRIAYPNQLELALSVRGRGEVVGEGVVLPFGHRYLLNDCIEKVADVLGSGNIVECGNTDPSSLVLPLVARVANRVLWLPHPNKDRRGEWSDFAKPIDGLLVERRPASTTVRKANRYPLRVVKNGQLTVLLGDRNCEVETSSTDGVTITYYDSTS